MISFSSSQVNNTERSSHENIEERTEENVTHSMEEVNVETQDPGDKIVEETIGGRESTSEEESDTEDVTRIPRYMLQHF